MESSTRFSVTREVDWKKAADTVGHTGRDKERVVARKKAKSKAKRIAGSIQGNTTLKTAGNTAAGEGDSDTSQ